MKEGLLMFDVSGTGIVAAPEQEDCLAGSFVTTGAGLTVITCEVPALEHPEIVGMMV